MAKSKKNSGGFQLYDKHSKTLLKLIQEAAYSKTQRAVFSDFVEATAISIVNLSNFKPKEVWENRERRYLDIINSYERRHQLLFPQMVKELELALTEKVHTTGPEDILGAIYHSLDMGKSERGQFFTPQEISDLMAKMVYSLSERNASIKEKGYIALAEPTCGSGVMITGFCKVMAENGLNYNRQLFVEATDIDLMCVHMAYIQLSLYGVPAIVIHGNSLTDDEWSRWFTPVYIAFGWDLKLGI